MEKTSPTRYGRLAQSFHWLTAVLVLSAFILGPEGSEQNIYLPIADFERQWHETLGLSVFALVALRLLWRFFDQRPAAPDLPRWMNRLSAGVHGLLYLLLFAVPLSAIAGAWLEGHPLTLLAGLQIAPPIAASHDLGESISELHGLLGDVILWLAGLHAAAAIFHHFRLKDQVLVSMLPRWLPFFNRPPKI